MTWPETAPWLSSFIGGLIGAFLSWFAAKKQIYSSLVSASRQNWINLLRDTICEFQGACASAALHALFKKEDTIGYAETMQRMLVLRSKISLLINPNEELHKELLLCVEKLLSIASKSYSNKEKDDSGFSDANKALTKVAQIALKREWETVKKGK